MTALRYYNVYGPRQNSAEKGGVISIFINSSLKKLPLYIEGTGTQERCFTFVEDVVRANLLAAGLKESNLQAFNIASNEIITINQLVKLVSNGFGDKPKIEHKPRRIGDIDKFNPDITKANKLLGYLPKVKFKVGLKKTIKYFEDIQTKI